MTCGPGLSAGRLELIAFYLKMNFFRLISLRCVGTTKMDPTLQCSRIFNVQAEGTKNDSITAVRRGPNHNESGACC